MPELNDIPRPPSRPARRSRIGHIGLAIVLITSVAAWTDKLEDAALLLLCLWLVGVAVCLCGLVSRPRLPAVLGLLFWVTVSGHFLWEVVRRDNGILVASDYPELVRTMGTRLAFFPRTLPPEATGIRIIGNGVFSIFPAPDAYVEVRYILSVEEAQKLQQRAASAAIPSNSPGQPGCDGIAERLRTVDDQDSSTPLPPGFSTYLLARPGGGQNIGGVSINASTGEVVYWLIEC